MFKVFRIVFCVLAVATAAAAIFIFALLDWFWGIITVAACLLFTAGMFLCRNAQVRAELKKNPPAPVGDFITGKVKIDDIDEK